MKMFLFVIGLSLALAKPALACGGDSCAGCFLPAPDGPSYEYSFKFPLKDQSDVIKKLVEKAKNVEVDAALSEDGCDKACKKVDSKFKGNYVTARCGPSFGGAGREGGGQH